MLFRSAAGGAAGAAVTGGDIGQAATTGALVGGGMGTVSGLFKANGILRQQQAQVRDQALKTQNSLDVSRADDASRSAFRPKNIGESINEIDEVLSQGIPPGQSTGNPKLDLILDIKDIIQTTSTVLRTVGQVTEFISRAAIAGFQHYLLNVGYTNSGGTLRNNMVENGEYGNSNATNNTGEIQY